MNRPFGLAQAGLAILIAGCIPVPIPAKNESVVYGRAFGDNEVRAMMSGAETADAIRARLGEPMVDFGPRRVFVYGWTLDKGSVAIVAVGGTIVPWHESHLLIVAFDQGGKVLKSGTVDYSVFQSMSGQVRRWLAFSGLADQVTSPRPDGAAQSGRMLYVYRPSSSKCSFPLSDPSFYKLKITVDGKAVGDVPKGAYLASEIGPDAHAIVIESYADYFSGTDPKGPCSACSMLDVVADTERTAYIEAYMCTGWGPVQLQAAVRSAEVALKAMRDLQPAW